MKLYFKYGAMGAGKTIELQKTAYNYIERGMKVMIFNSEKDKRYGEGIVGTRVGMKMNATIYGIKTDFLDYKKEYTNNDCILVDEAQFLTPSQVDQLRDITVDFDIPVICFGIRTDFQTKFFPGALRLMEIADTIQELKTLCWCGKKAICNTRIKDGKIILKGSQVNIGGNEKYITLCYKHYKQKRIKA